MAHHLRNPTFTTHSLSGRETADDTNPCLRILLESGFNEKNSLIFDHVARRDVVDALRSYPQSVMACHERFITDLRNDMKAVVEVVYDDAVQSRLLNALKLEPFPLWGKFKEVPVYLEWACDQNDNLATQSRLLRFIVFAYHPQAFVFPWGARKYGAHQDLVMTVAAGLAKMEANHDYYQNRSYESKAKFEEHVYKSKAGQIFGERAANNESSQSPLLGSISVEYAQRFNGLEPQTKDSEILYGAYAIKRAYITSQGPTSFQQIAELEATCV